MIFGYSVSVMLWAHCRCAVKIFCIELSLIDLLVSQSLNCPVSIFPN